jgi:N-formylglutamate deformylase
MKKNTPFTIIEPTTTKIPFILSIPHCGIAFPDEIKDNYTSDLIKQPDDTDWFLERLYAFASDLGITIIHANYSRWVIDLNRDPESQPLYDDGRIITALTPVTDFLGNSIYAHQELAPNQEEIERRLATYYWPYYHQITTLINELQKEHEHVLFWDAHSIRSMVPTIRKDKFPALILGNNDETTAASQLIKAALQSLQQSNHEVTHNTPFKGGHLTRYFGKPDQNVHALQLEMIKSLYMTEDELYYSEEKANEIQKILQLTFRALIQELNNLNHK